MSKPRTITLTQANEEGFDAEKLGFDIKNMSNVKTYRVLRVVELVNEGHLHYVKLEFNSGDVADPEADPMIVGTITKMVDSGDDGSPKAMDSQWRVMWDNKLWRILDDDAATLLESFQGISKESVKKFADQMKDASFKEELFKKLTSEAATNAGWKPMKPS